MVMAEVGDRRWRAFATSANMAHLKRHLVTCGQQGNVYAAWLYAQMCGGKTADDGWTWVRDLLFRMQQADIGRPCASGDELRALLGRWAEQRGLWR